MSTKIAVVGAGPTGLTLALMAQKQGHEVVIYEASQKPDPRPRAVMVHARALEILASLDLAKNFINRGLMTPGIDFIRSDGARFTMDFSSLETSYAGILNIPQPEIEEILATAFLQRGGVIHRNSVVTAFQQKSQSVMFDVSRDGTTSHIEANWLFGCDGAHSTIRNLIGASFDGDTIDHEYILGEGERKTPGAPDVSSMLISETGVVSWLPFKDGTVRVAGPGRGVSLNQIGQHSTDSSERAIELFYAEQNQLIFSPQYLIGRIIRAGLYRVHKRIASNWGYGRVWLAGDAAHLHPPAGGQALNLGLSDAEAIAMRLTTSSGIGFETYELERRPIVKATIEEVSMLPLIAAMREASSDTEFVKIEKALSLKAHRLSQIDTNFLAGDADCLGNRDDKELKTGRRLNEKIDLMDAINAPPGWKFASVGEHNYWVHADRHVRKKSPQSDTTFSATGILSNKETVSWE
ncbi:FAD-dependent oxidoreductase [Advenella mimigardefordensis]|uniref:Putative FAD-binding domain-containing monooxygenase n=1 Tax=Advenella mimigardefordensis (strain DSM 17166 / LMG 22922 / DPN7) TaxID=1247726 RepID=W0PI09_ADVMD|nr:FAD-dependent monooxygenase [Advenella mimigardefordensis]AHG65427.1 putative FAD-binding domain-containing monooxygenase [Advenella mimigardefordensis DPN7]